MIFLTYVFLHSDSYHPSMYMFSASSLDLRDRLCGGSPLCCQTFQTNISSERQVNWELVFLKFMAASYSDNVNAQYTSTSVPPPCALSLTISCPLNPEITGYPITNLLKHAE